jgi:hypothetical protein
MTLEYSYILTENEGTEHFPAFNACVYRSGAPRWRRLSINVSFLYFFPLCPVEHPVQDIVIVLDHLEQFTMLS